ncbi:outer membrane protein assembly factor BamE [Pelagibius sp. Alg239-R121]|uniref:outer membrane protein assembly factor BamE n=1 Tax=Pelagibius sp. Alg239-R121 TaxID=2993448 RepID=UPI0024A7497F|nr:outer membrane protein assembly factor BamE [Pelagibius sp. Alg239-R121]
MQSTRRKVLRRHRAALLAGSCALGLLVSGCSNDIQVRGNLPDPEAIGEIETGVHSRRQVAERLGSPSTISTFEDRKWYYVGHKSTQFAFFKPEILERNVLVVTFDGTGKVDDTKAYTLADGQIIDPVSRTTPTEGRELTVLQQIFGNIGSSVPGTILGGGGRRESQRPR